MWLETAGSEATFDETPPFHQYALPEHPGSLSMGKSSFDDISKSLRGRSQERNLRTDFVPGSHPQFHVGADIQDNTHPRLKSHFLDYSFEMLDRSPGYPFLDWVTLGDDRSDHPFEPCFINPLPCKPYRSLDSVTDGICSGLTELWRLTGPHGMPLALRRLSNQDHWQ
jgi:hypothetical protein